MKKCLLALSCLSLFLCGCSQQSPDSDSETTSLKPSASSPAPNATPDAISTPAPAVSNAASATIEPTPTVAPAPQAVEFPDYRNVPLGTTCRQITQQMRGALIGSQLDDIYRKLDAATNNCISWAQNNDNERAKNLIIIFEKLTKACSDRQEGLAFALGSPVRRDAFSSAEEQEESAQKLADSVDIDLNKTPEQREAEHQKFNEEMSKMMKDSMTRKKN